MENPEPRPALTDSELSNVSPKSPRKMKQDLSEVEVQVESKTRYGPDPDFSHPHADDAPPI